MHFYINFGVICDKNIYIYYRLIQWRSREFTSGWAQTQKFEDLPINLYLCKRFRNFWVGFATGLIVNALKCH
jgi:hypothetical protein